VPLHVSEIFFEFVDVGEVTVMREGDAVGAVGIEGLGFRLTDRALGRIPDVSDPYLGTTFRTVTFTFATTTTLVKDLGHAPLVKDLGHDPLIKDLGHESYPLLDVDFTVGLQGSDPGRILAAVLEIGERGH